MTLRERIRDWLGIEERAITPAQLFNTGQWVDLAGTSSGQVVTAETAMRAALGSCVRLLADDISTLPVNVMARDGRVTTEVPPPSWLERQGHDGFLFNYISDWITSLGTDGNAFTLTLPNRFYPEFIEVLDPTTAEFDEKSREIHIKANGVDVPEDRLLWVPWLRMPGKLRGISPVEASRESVGLELAAQKWAGAFFRNGGTLGGIITVPGGPETVDAEKLREQFEAKHKGERNWHKPAVLTGGGTYSAETVKPAEAELAPLWTHVLEEAMRVYHIPPHLLSVIDTGAAARASVEERGISYVRHAARPFATRFEQSHGRMLPEGQFLKLNMNALLRGDAKTRAEFYSTMLDAKVMAREEVRDLEDLPFVGELGWLETPNNNGVPESTPSEEPRSLSIDTTVIGEDSTMRIIEQTREASKAGAADVLAEVRERMDAQDAVISGQDKLLAELLAASEEFRSALTARNDPPDISTDGDFVYYRRGREVTRKRVMRDERGRVTGLVAA